jgi:hypothetical protein
MTLSLPLITAVYTEVPKDVTLAPLTPQVWGEMT